MNTRHSPLRDILFMFSLVFAGTSAAVCGLRGVCFALFDEAHGLAALIGTATGLVSVIGDTPDSITLPASRVFRRVASRDRQT